MRGRNGIRAAIALTLALIPAAAFAQTVYTLVDPAVGSAYDGVTINTINNAGHMAGYGVVTATQEIHAFIYHDGAFQDLGLLGYQASDAISINDSDQLAVDGIGPGSTALIFTGGLSHRLGSVDGGYSSAYSINSHGDIVGSAKNGDNATVGFSWIGGVFSDLSGFGIYKASGINDAGQIVGSSGYYWVYGGYGHSSSHGCLFTGTAFTDLGSLTGDPRTNTEAFGINAAGDIVGYSQAADGTQHAFLYTGGAMQDLGAFPGENANAIAINSHGLIIGNRLGLYGANLGAFVYENGQMLDLSGQIVNGGEGWTNLVVTGLNDQGDIVGYGTVGDATRGFLLVPGTTTAVRPTPVARTVMAAAQPNPFRSNTTIPIELSARAAAGSVRLEIFDASGRRVASLLHERLSPGAHSVRWSGRGDDGAPSPSGLYFARLTTLDGALSRKLVLSK